MKYILVVVVVVVIIMQAVKLNAPRPLTAEMYEEMEALHAEHDWEQSN